MQNNSFINTALCRFFDYLTFCFKQFFKNISLQIVNIIGASIMLVCLLFSVNYLNVELSYDKHHSNANKIARLSLEYSGEQVDGRIMGNFIYGVLDNIPEIEKIGKLEKIFIGNIKYKDFNYSVGDACVVSKDFLDIFDIPLVYGDKGNVLKTKEQVIISESFARKVFGENYISVAPNSTLVLDGLNLIVSGIFKDLPTTSHIKSDIFFFSAFEYHKYHFCYLLLKGGYDLKSFEQVITDNIERAKIYPIKVKAILMPLTDIHLYSNNLREVSTNGNINFIYLIIGINLLLLIVVLFNLWLNSSLIFSTNSKQYQIKRLYGATQFTIIKNEVVQALIVQIIAVFISLISVYISNPNCLKPINQTIIIYVVFIIISTFVYIIPALSDITFTLFSKNNSNCKVKNSYKNIRWMLIIQYCVVIIIVITCFGVNKQLNFMKNLQAGGDNSSILVINKIDRSVSIKQNVLKEKLLQTPYIKDFTSCFQIPGEAIRDGVSVKTSKQEDSTNISVMVVKEGFLNFFKIKLLAGNNFSPLKLSYQQEENLLFNFINTKTQSNTPEEYIINKKALQILGYNTPDEAIGQPLTISQGSIDYFNKGIIVGVTEDFNYSGLNQQAHPLIILQRNLFQNYIMVKLDNSKIKEAQDSFLKVWKEVNPSYEANYTFLSSIFNNQYHNEIMAQKLVNIFALLCFSLANLGLIIFVAFILKKRTKEITIRRIHGAEILEIIKMLNKSLMWYIIIAFIVAAPIAYIIMVNWQNNFIYKTHLEWWIFLIAGCIVLGISLICVLVQSYNAVKRNPIGGIK